MNGFVRYRMTDNVLEAKQEPCPDCGRPYTPRLIKLGGRSGDYLYSIQNGWIPPAIITIPMKVLQAIQETQLFQREKYEVVIRYTVRPQADVSMVKTDFGHIQAGLHRLFGNETKIRFERIDDFPRGPTGKFKWIICELDETP